MGQADLQVFQVCLRCRRERLLPALPLHPLQAAVMADRAMLHGLIHLLEHADSIEGHILAADGTLQLLRSGPIR